MPWRNLINVDTWLFIGSGGVLLDITAKLLEKNTWLTTGLGIFLALLAIYQKWLTIEHSKKLYALELEKKRQDIDQDQETHEHSLNAKNLQDKKGEEEV